MSGDVAKGLGIGILAGAAIGAVVGILYAPKSGRETRDAIQESAMTLANRIGSQVSEVSQKIGSQVSQAGRRIGAQVSQTGEKMTPS